MHLDDNLRDIFRILPVQAQALKRLGLETVRDLLFHFPARYIETAEVSKVKNLKPGERAVVFGRLSNLRISRALRKRIPMAQGTVTDETGQVRVIWFHQAYLAKMLKEGSPIRMEGKVGERAGKPCFSNPEIEISSPTKGITGRDGKHSLSPVYPETQGVTSNWFRHKIEKVFVSKILDTIKDPLPESILKTYKLPGLRTALIYIHTPQKAEHAQIARKRFAFEEIFFIQLERQKSREEVAKHGSFKLDDRTKEVLDFTERLPFKLTEVQKRTIKEILGDLNRKHPMSRLLEGDVGSGKTAVAATAVYAVSTSKPKGQDFGTLQSAYMAPTEILAQQHFDSFIKYFSHLPINIALITGSGCKKFPSKINPSIATNISRSQLLKWVASGEITVLIGTHVLIQKNVEFKHLALVIVDEQHRFGTNQRQKLVSKNDEKKGVIPHLLSMTATPIPRTLALTIYGDLDLSLLDEMPPGRKRIVTTINTPEMREKAYENIREELAAGRQLYVICPRIDEPNPNQELAMQAKSVKAEAKRLEEDVFPEYEIGILHSKMRPQEKEQVMNDFKEKKVDILVATSVVEVGVNVENASLIIIEGAERFGLAQLHQLRGRVWRSNHQAYCYIFTESRTEKTLARLKALATAKNGFELAEMDLTQRGAGALVGGRQWGLSDLGMEAIKNIKMVEAARKEARSIIESDPELSKDPLLKGRLAEKSSKKIHFE